MAGEKNEYDLIASENITKMKSHEWRQWRESLSPDLSQELNLSHSDLSAMNLENFNLQNLNLSNSILDGSRLLNANLQNSKLKGASLKKANLVDAKCRNADFTDADLDGIVLGNQFLLPDSNGNPNFVAQVSDQSTSLHERFLQIFETRLSEKPTKAKPEHVQRVSGEASDWNKWYLEKRKSDVFFYAHLSTVFSTKQKLNDRLLHLADFRNAGLSGIDFSNAYLSFSDMSGADLRNANLKTANLTGTKLIGANLTGASLPPTPLDENLIKDARFDDPENKGGMKPDTKNTGRERDTKLATNIGKSVLLKFPLEDHPEILNLLGEAGTVKAQLTALLSTVEAQSVQISNQHQHLAEVNQGIEKTLQSVSDASDSSAQLAAAKAISGVEDKIQAALHAVQDNFVFKDAKADWANKSRNHWVLFCISILIFIGSVSALIWGSYAFHDEIMDLIPKNNNGDYGFGAIAVVTIPIAAIAWVLRIFTRFALQNLTLAQDAAQRRIIFDTYIKLVQETAPQMGENDRAIMLAAIFRPLPGAHQTDVAPPNLLDLIGKKAD